MWIKKVKIFRFGFLRSPLFDRTALWDTWGNICTLKYAVHCGYFITNYTKRLFCHGNWWSNSFFLFPKPDIKISVTAPSARQMEERSERTKYLTNKRSPLPRIMFSLMVEEMGNEIHCWELCAVWDVQRQIESCWLFYGKLCSILPPPP